ncbi:MAG TPA: DUF2189 domain-containing protein [Bosea sp. (in: a-proteobacteria)]|jgi:uncharacterized membrane protein|uniref:DUF2189 domain-containing protein n=1 Tax=Bosea sp. (in: a-proteobacteria) TaxID=1871050 RepID=UPI002E10ADAB|nr:DUF2189 domain-containing protein [Bosea sp. (in: a-proteobacteria)]
MANLDSHFDDAPRAAAPALPRILTISTADLLDALRLGWEDFKAQPSHLAFVALIYPICGVLLAHLTVSFNIFPLLFPLLGGFALLGPFAAIGLYEISRRRERQLDTSWQHAFALLRSPAISQILLLGAMLTGLFMAWLISAWLIYRGLLGLPADVSTADFLRAVFTTFNGWIMIIVGNSVGLLFAILAFSISVTSFPHIIDRRVDVATAIRTSVAAVEKNPRVMMIWGLMVTGLLVLGCLPMLVGLVVVMPVLGHATWHLYRKVIDG